MESLLREQNARVLHENQKLQVTLVQSCVQRWLVYEYECEQEEVRHLRVQLHEACKRVPDYETALGKSQKRCSGIGSIAVIH